MDAGAGRQLRLWMIAGEESGDQLGAKVMRALRARLPDTVLRFEGVGGRAMAGEHVAMMGATGRGEVYYGRAGLHVTVVPMNGQMLTVEASRLLAHSAHLSSSVVMLGQQGGVRSMVRGAVTGQGLFTTQLTGHGTAVLISHGPIFEIEVGYGKGDVAVDPQAYVAHRGQIDVKLDANVSWRDAVGKGAGEAFQLKMQGQGTVYIQPAER